MITSNTINTIQEKIKKQLYEKNFFTNLLEIIESKTKVERLYIAYGIVGFLSLYLIVGWGNVFLCNLIGFIYPAYASIKAIDKLANEDDTKWLIYWLIYALFSLLEAIGSQASIWFPFYWLLKCLFLIWLMMSGKSGGTYIISKYNLFNSEKVIKAETQPLLKALQNEYRLQTSEINAKTTFQVSATGPVSISECSPVGKVIILENKSKNTNIVLTNWVLKRHIDNKAEITYKFPENLTLKANKLVRIWARGHGVENFPTDLVNKDIENWGMGVNIVTCLLNDVGEEKAKHSQITYFLS